MRAKGPPLPVVTRTRNRKHAPLSYSQHDAHVRTPLLAHTRTHARTHSPRGCDISARAHPRVCAFRFAIWLCAQHADVYAQRVACALVCFPLAFGQVRGLGVIGHEDCLVLDLCVRAPPCSIPQDTRSNAHSHMTGTRRISRRRHPTRAISSTCTPSSPSPRSTLTARPAHMRASIGRSGPSSSTSTAGAVSTYGLTPPA